ncbi:unnamed protein product [Amoebophrya sp. A25]|nr:unnamed protein product [Amoebophrya sp. A25]|eukprot:GSA25T00007976001.1
MKVHHSCVSLFEVCCRKRTFLRLMGVKGGSLISFNGDWRGRMCSTPTSRLCVRPCIFGVEDGVGDLFLLTHCEEGWRRASCHRRTLVMKGGPTLQRHSFWSCRESRESFDAGF